MRVATIDIGTNTILLLVAERRDAERRDAERRDAERRGGELHAVYEEADIVRLGEGVDVSRKLKPEAIERARVSLTRYAAKVRELNAERIAVVGTSAMRDAGGGDDVRACVRELFGVDARTISGDEEARLTFVGGTSGLDVRGEVGVFDIGGGSTEIVIGEADRIRYAKSFDIGSVRLTERHVKNDPPSKDDLDRVRANASSALEAIAPPQGELVGIAGTVTTLAAIALELEPYDGAHVHNHVLSRSDLERVIDRISSLPLEERKRVPGLEPKRADVIVAGGLIVLAVMDHLKKSSIRVSDRGVRWGLAEELSR
jgi:exopolyphosphatase/guanosine-5'-triphosphate,3'-diphosphate pyrophosphatase